MSLRDKNTTYFSRLGELFGVGVSHSSKADILIRAFDWCSSKVGYTAWNVLHDELRKGVCDYVKLHSLFESEPELHQFIPSGKVEDVLWD